MQFSMKNLDQLSVNEMEELLSSSRKVIWQAEDSDAKYDWIGAVLKAQRYGRLGKREKRHAALIRRPVQPRGLPSREHSSDKQHGAENDESFPGAHVFKVTPARVTSGVGGLPLKGRRRSDKSALPYEEW